MPATDLRVNLDAEAAKLVREVRSAERAMGRLDAEISRGTKEADRFAAALKDRQAQALEKVGRGMVVFGAAVVAGLGLAAKAAIDWESAWAGVRKTVDGSPEQLAQLEGELRGLATTLPVTHAEIAAVAEVAGQLGVATEDVADFTEVMVMLGTTTNLSAEEAAVAIAQMMNVMQTAPEDVTRLASTLVDLGNNAATTERDILEMAQRIAGAGATIGLSEADVLAFATALASVGIEAAAGGSAISRVMVDIASAVAEGGEAVSGFAQVAGVSSKEFVRAFTEDPARAIAMFVEGLGRIDASGGNVFKTLEDLGLSEVRVRDALLRLSQGGDVLTDSLDRSEQAWADNTALIDEAKQRYDTAEAKIALARNALVDFAIDVGSVLLPVLASLIESVTDVFKWFGDLPGPVKTVVTVLGAVVGAVALVGGGFLLLAPRVLAARVAFQSLVPVMGRAAGAMRLFSLAIPGIGILLAAVAGIEALKNAAESAGPPVSEATAALLDLAEGAESKLITETIKAAGSMDVLAAAEEGAGRSANGAVAGLLNLGNRIRGSHDDVERFRKNMESIDKALAELVTGGNADTAEKAFKRLAEGLGLQGDQVDRLLTQMPQYTESLQRAENESRTMGEAEAETNAMIQEMTGAIEEQEASLSELIDELQAAGLLALDVRGAQRQLEESIDSATAAIKDNGKSLDRNTKEGRANEAALDDIADSAHSLVDAQIDAGASTDDVRESMKRARKQFIETAISMGRSREDAIKLADKLGLIPGDYVAIIKADRDNADKNIDTAQGKAKAWDRRVATARLKALDQTKSPISRAKDRIRSMVGKTVLISAIATGLAGIENALNNVARRRTSYVDVFYRQPGGGRIPIGPTAHSGGLITAGGIQRFHNGGTPGLAGDERVIVAQTGERVLSRQQNALFDQMMRTFGQPVQQAGPGSFSGAVPGGDFTYSVTIGATTEQVATKVREHERSAREAHKRWKG